MVTCFFKHSVEVQLLEVVKVRVTEALKIERLFSDMTLSPLIGVHLKTAMRRSKLDPDNVNSFRRISNLSFFVKGRRARRSSQT